MGTQYQHKSARIQNTKGAFAVLLEKIDQGNIDLTFERVILLTIKK